MFDSKMITLTVRANKPSQEALKRYTQTIVRVVRQCEERGYTDYDFLEEHEERDKERAGK